MEAQGRTKASKAGGVHGQGVCSGRVGVGVGVGVGGRTQQGVLAQEKKKRVEWGEDVISKPRARR